MAVDMANIYSILKLLIVILGWRGVGGRDDGRKEPKMYKIKTMLFFNDR